MGRKPASSARELQLIDALARLPSRRVAWLIWGDAGKKNRVLRRRRQRKRELERFEAIGDEELDQFVARQLEQLERESGA
jgi:hypothetical protein